MVYQVIVLVLLPKARQQCSEATHSLVASPSLHCCFIRGLDGIATLAVHRGFPCKNNEYVTSLLHKPNSYQRIASCGDRATAQLLQRNLRIQTSLDVTSDVAGKSLVFIYDPAHDTNIEVI